MLISADCRVAENVKQNYTYKIFKSIFTPRKWILLKDKISQYFVESTPKLPCFTKLWSFLHLYPIDADAY